MGDLLIRNIPEALRSDIESLARKRGQSLSETAREALRAGIEAASARDKDIEPLPAGERLRSIFAGVFDTEEEADEFAEILVEARRNAFGRPVPEPE
ncbi:plasmid stabilization protein [Aminobacter sp. Piv2-1]|uniref:plasmid stabilization protein n=1 Tax=Aminobacter sp. Piv2-1 TaxID=3031122 RepID=UPI0030A80289